MKLPAASVVVSMIRRVPRTFTRIVTGTLAAGASFDGSKARPVSGTTAPSGETSTPVATVAR